MVLPFDYLESMMVSLGSVPGVRFRTMAELDFPSPPGAFDEESFPECFRQEREQWRRRSDRQQGWDVFLLHDCDSGPRETETLCRFEARFGFPSTTSLFARWVQQGRVERYPIDFARLARMQRQGLCFTYHCNAYEVARYDADRLAEIYATDVAFLRAQGLTIDHFAPHGGRPGPDGRNNNSFFYPGFVQEPLHWTHNRFAPSGFRYSDGGFPRRLEAGAAGLDLLAFLLRCLQERSQGRAFILLHPQYYFARDDREAVPFFPRNPWLERFWEFHARGAAEAYWKPLRDAFGVTRPNFVWSKVQRRLWRWRARRPAGYAGVPAARSSQPSHHA